MATEQLFPEQFAEFVDEVLGVRGAAYTQSTAATEVGGHFKLVTNIEPAEACRVAINGVRFVRERAYVGNSLSIVRVAGFELGNVIASEADTGMIRTVRHNLKTGLHTAMAAQFADITTRRELEEEEQRHVVQWLRSPFTTPSLKPIFTRLNEKEMIEIDEQKNHTRQLDGKLSKLSKGNYSGQRVTRGRSRAK